MEEMPVVDLEQENQVIILWKFTGVHIVPQLFISQNEKVVKFN